MAVELTPFGKFTKWVIIPVTVGLIGFYVTGPRFGSRIAKKAEALKTQISGPEQSATNSDSAVPKRSQRELSR
jgi:hypothetical protein